MLHLDRSSKLICEPGEPGACLLIKAHMITIAHLIHEHIYIYGIRSKTLSTSYCMQSSTILYQMQRHTSRQTCTKGLVENSFLLQFTVVVLM